MSSAQKALFIMEGTVLPIRDFIKAGIVAQLAIVSASRPDARVTLEGPKDYFIFDKAIGYRCPAIFIMGDDIDFANERGQNYIASKNTVYISALIEDRNAELLTLKCWRYQDALFQLLDGAQIDVPGANIKNVVTVTRAEYSNTFQSKAQNPGDTSNPFRKEVMLTLDVEHFEQR